MPDTDALFVNKLSSNYCYPLVMSHAVSVRRQQIAAAFFSITVRTAYQCCQQKLRALGHRCQMGFLQVKYAT
jgi:hypothetical protein